MSYFNTKAGSVEEAVKGLSKDLNDSAYQDMFKKELEKTGKGIGSMSPKEKKDFFNMIDKKYSAKTEELSAAQKKLPPALQKAIKDKEDKKEEVSEGGPGSGPQKGGAKKSNFTSAQIKQAYGILNDPRYKQGNYSGAFKTINKVSPGLADHPDVKKALKRANEEVEIEKLKEDVSKLIETHTFRAKPMNKKQKDADGEKEIINPVKDETGGVKEEKAKMSEQTAKNFDLYRSIHSVWSNAAEDLEEVKKNAKYMKAQDVAPDNDADEDESEKDKKKTMINSQKTKVDTSPEIEYQK